MFVAYAEDENDCIVQVSDTEEQAIANAKVLATEYYEAGVYALVLRGKARSKSIDYVPVGETNVKVG